MTDLAGCTPADAERLLGDAAVAIQPIGATEPPGVPDPLDAKVSAALAISRAAAERLARDGVTAVVLPPLAYGLSRLVGKRAGWISLRPGTLWAILEDVFESLTEQGVRRIVLANAHFEPEHVEVLRGVILDHPEVTRHAAQVIHPDWTAGVVEEGIPPAPGPEDVERIADLVVSSVRETWPELVAGSPREGGGHPSSSSPSPE